MKFKNLLFACLSIAMISLADHAEAQKRYKYKKRSKQISRYSGSSRGSGRFQPYWFAGVSINTGNYFGDLAPVAQAASTDVSFTRPGFGVYGGYKFHHSLALRAGLNWTRVFGDDFSSDPNVEKDLPRYARNLSFRNDIKEFQLGLEVFLLPNYGGPSRRLPANAYLFIGATVFHHEPMGLVPDADYQADPSGAVPVESAGEWIKLRPLQTEGRSYNNIDISVPLAVGGHLRMPGTQLNVGIEFGIRYLFTDYIDDVSTNYVDLATLEANGGQLARVMSDRSTVPVSSQGNSRDLTNIQINNSQPHGFFTSGILGSGSDGEIRGNPDSNDFIFMTQLKLTYIIGGVVRRRAKYR